MEARKGRLACLLVMFLLSRISTFKFIRWLVTCPTISTMLRGFSVVVEIAISASGNFYSK